MYINAVGELNSTMVQEQKQRQLICFFGYLPALFASPADNISGFKASPSSCS